MPRSQAESHAAAGGSNGLRGKVCLGLFLPRHVPAGLEVRWKRSVLGWAGATDRTLAVPLIPCRKVSQRSLVAHPSSLCEPQRTRAAAASSPRPDEDRAPQRDEPNTAFYRDASVCACAAVVTMRWKISSSSPAILSRSPFPYGLNRAVGRT